MSRAVVIVQSCPGREDLTRRTLDALDDVGGARQLADDTPRLLWWTGESIPPSLPRGWILVHNETPPKGHRRDLWALMNFARGYGEDVDLVCFEDDVAPCVNAVRFMVAWPAYVFTTFYPLAPNVRGRYGLHAIDRKWGFWGTQAFKVPARLLARFIDAGDTDNRAPTEGGDTRIGRLLAAWREPIHYHRPIVQHVGVQSVHLPGATLTGYRAPVKDFDPALDALTLGCNG